MFVNGGLVGPKPRPKGVGNGQPVNIPALPYLRYHEGVTKFDKPGIRMVGCVSRKPSSGRKIRWEVKVSGDANSDLSEKLAALSFQEKPLRRGYGIRTANRHW